MSPTEMRKIENGGNYLSIYLTSEKAKLKEMRMSDYQRWAAPLIHWDQVSVRQQEARNSSVLCTEARLSITVKHVF